MVLSDLKLDDVVEYLWVGKWQRFTVTAVQTTITRSGAAATSAACKITLCSTLLGREAYVTETHVRECQLRWPATPDERALALAERAARLEAVVNGVLVEIGAIRRELSWP